MTEVGDCYKSLLRVMSNRSVVCSNWYDYPFVVFQIKWVGKRRNKLNRGVGEEVLIFFHETMSDFFFTNGDRWFLVFLAKHVTVP